MGLDHRASVVRREAVGQAGGAFILVFWTTIAVVLVGDAQPYAGGGWPLEASVALGAAAALGGFICRGSWGLAGVIGGLAAAISVQLFVLTGQAAWTPAVVASVRGFWWLPTVGGALIYALGVVVVGYAIGWALARRTEGPAPSSERRAPIAAVVAALVLVGLLLADASTSAYVIPDDEPTLTVEGADGRIVSIDPAVVPAGRVTLVVPGDVGSGGETPVLTWAMDPSQAADLAAGRLTAPTVTAVTDGTRVDLGPGTHAVVVVDWAATPPDPQTWDGSQPALSSATFEVSPVDPGTVRTRGDGGSVQVAGLLVALVLYGAAVAALLGWALRGRQAASPSGEAGAWTVPIIVGLVSSAILGALALLAVDLAHNPF